MKSGSKNLDPAEKKTVSDLTNVRLSRLGNSEFFYVCQAEGVYVLDQSGEVEERRYIR